MVTLLIIFIFLAGSFMSIGLQSDKFANPVFRKGFLLEAPLYLSVLMAVLVIAHEFFGPYILWVSSIFSLIAIPFTRKGYPDFLKIWREKRG